MHVYKTRQYFRHFLLVVYTYSHNLVVISSNFTKVPNLKIARITFKMRAIYEYLKDNTYLPIIYSTDYKNNLHKISPLGTKQAFHRICCVIVDDD